MGRLLADAQGYAVCAADGTPLGRLIWLIYDLERLWPAGLRVQPLGRGEPTFAGSWEIPVAKVIDVQPTRREVTVSEAGRPAAQTMPNGFTERDRTAAPEGHL